MEMVKIAVSKMFNDTFMHCKRKASRDFPNSIFFESDWSQAVIASRILLCSKRRTVELIPDENLGPKIPGGCPFNLIHTHGGKSVSNIKKIVLILTPVCR
jgi:hypothetical protein